MHCQSLAAIGISFSCGAITPGMRVQLVEIPIESLTDSLRLHKPDLLIVNPVVPGYFTIGRLKEESGCLEMKCVALSYQPADSHLVHAYDEEREENLIEICADIDCDNVLTVSVRDFGKGIADVEEAKEPFFTTKPDEERSGMGFTIIETFMDEMTVESEPGRGTKVVMRKRIGKNVES